MYDTAEERVTRGSEWLDENGPAEWWERVDLEDFSMWDGEKCVLGQVFAADADTTGVTNGYLFIVLGLERQGLDDTDFVISHGFCPGYDTTAEELRDEWARVISDRRALVSA